MQSHSCGGSNLVVKRRVLPPTEPWCPCSRWWLWLECRRCSCVGRVVVVVEAKGVTNILPEFSVSRRFLNRARFLAAVVLIVSVQADQECLCASRCVGERARATTIRCTRGAGVPNLIALISPSGRYLAKVTLACEIPGIDQRQNRGRRAIRRVADGCGF